MARSNGGGVVLQPGPRGRRPTAATPLSPTWRGDQALPDLPLTLTLPIPAGFCGQGGLAGGTPYCERGAERRDRLTLSTVQQYKPGLGPAAGRRRLPRVGRAGVGGERALAGGGAARQASEGGPRREATGHSRCSAESRGSWPATIRGGLTAGREASGAVLQCARIPHSTSFRPPLASCGYSYASPGGWPSCTSGGTWGGAGRG